MFSVEEKQLIAAAVEKVLLELNHPEMPTEQPQFELTVIGKEAWSYALITPNWTFSETNPPKRSPWNENARNVLAKPKRMTMGEEK